MDTNSPTAPGRRALNDGIKAVAGDCREWGRIAGPDTPTERRNPENPDYWAATSVSGASGTGTKHWGSLRIISSP